MSIAEAPIETATGLYCEHVSKIWGEDTSKEMLAVDDVSLRVAPGEFVVMLGPSGCGKSTLLSMMAGLVTASSGTITNEGKPVTGPGPDRCMIFQQSSLYPWLTVGQNVGFGLKLRGVSRSQRAATSKALLKKMGLIDFIDKRPGELSGGMLQRAAIARSLAMKPGILLMDEPFAALDVQTRSRMQSYIQEIRDEGGVSVVFVTHSIEEAIALADRIVVFTARPGRIKAIVDVDLGTNRDPRDPRSHELRDRLFDLLADEVDRAFAEQEEG